MCRLRAREGELLAVLYLLGYAAAALSVVLFLPSLAALAFYELPLASIFVVSSVLSGFIAGSLLLGLRWPERELRRVDLLSLAALVWTTSPVIAALPFALAGSFTSGAAALFEASSGLTTTGATLFPASVDIPRAFMFYRALLEWYGGGLMLMTILLVLAPTQLGGLNSWPLHFMESGAVSERRRIMNIFRHVMPVYLLMTMLCFIALALAGLSSFDAMCLALSTLATGGMVAPHVAAAIDGDPMILSIVGVFGLVGASSVIWQYVLLTQRWQHARRYAEGGWMLMIVLLGGALFSVDYYLHTGSFGQTDWIGPLRYGFNASVALITTSGVAIGPGDLSLLNFPAVLGLALLGGAAFSTAGGVKLFRAGMVLERAYRDVARLIHPRGIRPSRLGNRPFDPRVIKPVWTCVMAFIMIFSLLLILLAVAGLSFEAGLAMSASILSNNGPLYIGLMPGDGFWPRFHELDHWLLVVLSVVMVAVRIEVLVFLALLSNVRLREYWPG